MPFIEQKESSPEQKGSSSEQKGPSSEQKGPSLTLFARMMGIKESTVKQNTPTEHIKGPSLGRKESTVGTDRNMGSWYP
jgi:hypothetical protein